MKIGLILECVDGGADEIVCKHFIKLLLPNAEVKVAACSNKPNLIRECGKHAQTLFGQGCDKIIIVWDLHPSWKDDGGKPCRREDKLRILRNLYRKRREQRKLGEYPEIRLKDIYMVCIERELEAWLIADKNTLIGAFPYKENEIRDYKNPETEDAKAIIKRLSGSGKNRYVGSDYQVKRLLPPLEAIRKLRRRSPTFERFVQKVTNS